MSEDGPVLVPLDGSTLAEYAIPVGAAIAARRGAVLRLVHVHTALGADPIYVEGLPLLDEHLHPLRRLHEETYLRQAQALASGVPVELDILEDPVASALVQHAERAKAQLVVMTTHGRGGFERLWLGSVADDLARRSPAPLLLLRPEGHGRPPVSFRRILVPLDGSPLSELVLPSVERFARDEQGAEIVLVQVVRTALWGTALNGAVPPEGHNVADGEMSARENLERVAGPLRSAGLSTRTLVLSDVPVAGTILAAARSEGADLLALATHGRAPLARAVLGSVSDKLVRGSHLPVLLHRPHAAAATTISAPAAGA